MYDHTQHDLTKSSLEQNATPGPSAATTVQSSQTTSQSSSTTHVSETPPSSSHSSQELESVRDLANAILVLHQSKVPFRKIDMANMVDMKAKMPQQLIDGARRHLKSVFGFKLIQVDGVETHYIIVRDKSRPLLTKRQTSTGLHDAILVLVLAVIFMTDENGCPVDKIKEFLMLINLEDDDEIWTGSDNVKLKDLLTRTWVKQLYLEKFDNEDILTKKIETTIGWGFRARQEFVPMDILKLVSDIMATEPEAWREQHARAFDGTGDTDVTIVSQMSSPRIVTRTRSTVQRGVSGATHRIVVGGITDAVRRGILSESNRFNRQAAPSSR